ncbi:MAG: hypothetical protein LLF98_08540 [Clostridium sp.]|uniref:hypothetical protein n=1 Tax=Clostridium sp. TaxID=1506 RepID=UPI0025B85778|nr:hypothetical protein [Clostridium sp.]MCE5221297.1 hypothetical protein [Clostridium sp.]
MNIEVLSGTVVTGASDDLIEISGELEKEFNAYDCSDETIAFSDGTLLRVDYDKNGIWRFKPIYKGNLFEKIVDSSVPDDTNDEVYFKDGLKWCVFSDEMQVEVNRNRK